MKMLTNKRGVIETGIVILIVMGLFAGHQINKVRVEGRVPADQQNNASHWYEDSLYHP